MFPHKHYLNLDKSIFCIAPANDVNYPQIGNLFTKIQRFLFLNLNVNIFSKAQEFNVSKEMLFYTFFLTLDITNGHYHYNK